MNKSFYYSISAPEARDMGWKAGEGGSSSSSRTSSSLLWMTAAIGLTAVSAARLVGGSMLVVFSASSA